MMHPSRICDFMKQVRTIEEPFTVSELTDLVLMTRPTTLEWVLALEKEGLIEQCGTTTASNRIVNLYKRIGAFK